MSSIENGGPSPVDMGTEVGTGRPTESDFAKKLEGLLFPLQHGIRMQHEGTKNQFRNMANGDDESGVREQYYPGWTNEDFAEMLKRLEEAEETYL